MENIIFDNMLVLYSGQGYFKKPHSLNPIPFADTHVKDYFNKDFYGFGQTRADKLSIQGIPSTFNYKIEGVTQHNGKGVLSSVYLLNSDLAHVKAVNTDKDGKYVFENIANGQYTIISTDFSSKYNHSIIAGVKPSEII